MVSRLVNDNAYLPRTLFKKKLDGTRTICTAYSRHSDRHPPVVFRIVRYHNFPLRPPRVTCNVHFLCPGDQKLANLRHLTTSQLGRYRSYRQVHVDLACCYSSSKPGESSCILQPAAPFSNFSPLASIPRSKTISLRGRVATVRLATAIAASLQMEKMNTFVDMSSRLLSNLISRSSTIASRSFQLQKIGLTSHSTDLG